MQDLWIPGTEMLPEVSFKTSGDLRIYGRALPEDAGKFFTPVFDWLRDFTSEVYNIEVNLDYFNTSVSKKLLDFFRIIESKPGNKQVNVKWMYEDGDDEMLESGEIYKELLPGFNFSFHKYAEFTR
jgi:hypothetical protein